MRKFISSNELWDSVLENIGHPNSPRGCTNISITKEYGKMDINHYSTGLGIRYWSIGGIFKSDVSIENTNSSDSNFLCFNVGSNIYMEDARKNKKVRWNHGACLHGEQYVGHISNSLYSKDSEVCLHCIGFDKELFKDIVKDNDDFKNTGSFYRGDYIEVNLSSQINIHQKILLKELLQASSLNGGKLQEIYLESKLLELVYTSINALETKGQNENFYLSPKDTECLHKAKELLLSDIANPPSIKELAFKSAINEFKLKKGFKRLFGTTVYGLLHDYRLEHAKAHLSAGDINVQEAAKLVGYKSVSHFCKIFKTRYKAMPYDILREGKRQYIYF